MECQCETLKAAQDWASRLPLQTDKLIQIVFATGGLDKSYVLVSKKQFAAGFDQFAVFNFDEKTKCAKLLGALNSMPTATHSYNNVLIDKRSLTPLSIRQAKPTKTPRLRKGEFTVAEAESALRLRFRALQDPKSDSAQDLVQNQRQYEISALLARIAASQLQNENEWLHRETALAEYFADPDASDLPLLFPGASTSGLAEELRQHENSSTPWFGPVPFEVVSPALAKAHKAHLVRGQAFIPYYGLKWYLARRHVRTTLQPVPNLLRQWPSDPRLGALCKLWIRLLEQDVTVPTAAPLHSLPPCMKRLMTEVYPEHKHRQVATNVLCRLGHQQDAERILMRGWAPLIEAKHPTDAPKKKTEIANAVKAFSKTFERASYSCQWMQVHNLCPYFQFPKTTPSAALRQCFNCKVLPPRPSPVVFVVAGV